MAPPECVLSISVKRNLSFVNLHTSVLLKPQTPDFLLIFRLKLFQFSFYYLMPLISYVSPIIRSRICRCMCVCHVPPYKYVCMQTTKNQLMKSDETIMYKQHKFKVPYCRQVYVPTK